MKKSDLKNSNFIVNESSSIQEAMIAMSGNRRRAVILVDEDLKYKGVLSNGDINRGMVRGMTIFAPVIAAANFDAMVLKNENPELEEQAKKIFKEYDFIHIIPVVNKKNYLVDIKVRPAITKS